MPVEVKKYAITIYGSPRGFFFVTAGVSGYIRAQIRLMSQNNQTVALLFFHDLAMRFPENDGIDQNIIQMHLPSSMYQSVIDFLRNQRPIYIDFDTDSNKASLTSPPENVGS